MTDRLNGRLAFLIAVFAVLVLILVGWYAFISPQRSKAASLDGQIATAQGQIASTQAYLKSPATKRYGAELRRLKLAVPDQVQMSQILRQLSWAAARAGVSITSITPSAPVASSGGQAVPIALDVQGHYFRLSNFFRLLRTRTDVKGKQVKVSGRLYSMDEIQFSTSNAAAGASAGSNSLISASVKLNAFIATPAPAPPTTTSTTTTDSSTQ